MSDSYFREIVGVHAGATREEIKRAYRRQVMENHPDRFPDEEKPLQELKIVTLTEAYTALMGRGEAAEERQDGDGGRSGPAAAVGRRPRPPVASSRPGIGPLKDPAYAYYKQGFLNFSLAVHGIAEANQRVAEEKSPGFRPYRVAQDFANSLSLLQAAHGYFERVVEDHAGCVWEADARWKLKRIERFTKLYRRILSNLGGRPAQA